MLFIRCKKFKPYVCPALRNRPWHKKAREKLLITWRNLKPKLARWGELLFMDIPATSILSVSTYDVLHGALHDTNDMFDSSISSLSNDDSFAFDDDDMARGMWDVSSIYYPICHSDDDWSSSDATSCFSTSDSFDI